MPTSLSSFFSYYFLLCNPDAPAMCVFLLLQEYHCLCTVFPSLQMLFSGALHSYLIIYSYLIAKVTSSQKLFLTTVTKITLTARTMYPHFAKSLLQSKVMIFLFSYLLHLPSSRRTGVVDSLPLYF